MMVTNYMFALPKGTQLSERISGALLHLQEEGILQMLFHKWWNTEECVGFTDSGYHYDRMETNNTWPTEVAFVPVRRQTTEMPRVLPSQNKNPTLTPDEDYDAHLSNIPPIVESITENPTIHSSKYSDSLLMSSLSSTTRSPEVSSHSTVNNRTSSFHNTTNRRRHNNGRHGNKSGSGNRGHGRLNSDRTTTPGIYWGINENPKRVPDYVEGVDSSILNIASPFPYNVDNTTQWPSYDKFTFRPITYTVPTTLTTQAPAAGRNRNRINKNEDKLQENTYNIVENGCRSHLAHYGVLFSIVFLCSFTCKLIT